jgi:Flp pilus assembly protein TadG
VRRLFDFWRDQRGNTAIIFGLAAVPLLALGGGAVDFAQRARVHGELQSASDTAALAAARLVQTGLLKRGSDWDEADWDALKLEAETMAENLVAASLPTMSGDNVPDIDIQVTQTTVSISAHYDVDTAILGVIGMDTLPTSTFAEVAVPDPILVEISLVLDYSLSMHQNSKYTRMTAAAREFIEKVEEERGDRTKIGIIPFSEFVYAEVSDLDVRPPEVQGSGAWDGGSTYDGDVDWQGGLPTGGGGGGSSSAKCLINRDYPYSTTNETPTGLIATRWRQADEDSSRCQAYQDGGLQARDLTDDFEGLSEALANMQPVGWTNIALATEMGWHMLSPNEPFETARDFSDPYVRKILVVLTDGKQTIPATGPSGESSLEQANLTTSELCEEIKDDDIMLYTIAYDVDDTSVYTLMSDCASSPSAYFEVHDSSGIGAVFEEIFSQIAESAWLSR